MESFEDAALLTDATAGLMLYMRPPLGAQPGVYIFSGTLKGRQGGTLIVDALSQFSFTVEITRSTKFLSRSMNDLRVGSEVSFMGNYLGADGSGDLNNAIKAIDYAIEKHVQVISASWGAAVPASTAQPLIEAIGRAEKAGIIFVTAAANDGKNNDTTDVYPANAGLPNMITVSASNSGDAKPSWSNYGKAKVSLAAPGDAIVSTVPGNGYSNL